MKILNSSLSTTSSIKPLPQQVVPLDLDVHQVIRLRLGEWIPDPEKKNRLANASSRLTPEQMARLNNFNMDLNLQQIIRLIDGARNPDLDNLIKIHDSDICLGIVNVIEVMDGILCHLSTSASEEEDKDYYLNSYASLSRVLWQVLEDS